MFKKIFFILFNIFFVISSGVENKVHVCPDCGRQEQKDFIDYGVEYISYMKSKTEDAIATKKELMKEQVRKKIAHAIMFFVTWFDVIKNRIKKGIQKVYHTVDYIYDWALENS
jgi:hypothetical protein